MLYKIIIDAMKSSISLVLTFASLVAYAQTLPPAAQAVADAENNFARTSKEKSTKVAFLANLDPNSVVFSQGNPVNGIEQWTNTPEGPGLLFWWPVFVEAAASGDFGYSTGPYEISRDRNEAPAGFGYYSSVWKKDAQGTWKVVTDMGIAFPKREDTYPTLKTTPNPLKTKGSVNAEKTKTDLLALDRQYVEKLNSTGRSFDAEALSAEARIHRMGNWPCTTPDAIRGLDETNKKFKLEQLGGDVASSADLGYTYGKATVTVTRDGNTRELPFNYLRVWKKEQAGWKIVLDVIGG